MSKFINQEAFEIAIGDLINKEMLRAAEPIIEECMKEVEKKMRAATAQFLVQFIQSNYSMERMGTDLRIIINQEIKQ